MSEDRWGAGLEITGSSNNGIETTYASKIESFTEKKKKLSHNTTFHFWLVTIGNKMSIYEEGKIG